MDRQKEDLARQHARIEAQEKAENAKASPDAQKIKDLAAQKASIEKQQADNQDRIDTQSRVVSDDETALQAVKDQQSSQESDLKDAPAQLAAAQTSLAEQQKQITEMRRSIQLLADDDVRAFAEARDNAPFLYAPPRAASTDPAARVILYGYPDSKTIFIRGAVEDVDQVRDIIATFDRPAPQARISLYTLQMNGPFTEGLNHAMQEVDNTLRDLRSATTLFQSVLRDAVNDEVNRIAFITELVSPKPEEASVDTASGKIASYPARLARAFYYPEEMRQAQGFNYRLPRKAELTASLYYDMQMFRKYFNDARQAQQNADFLTYRNRDDARAESERLRTADLHAASFHLESAKITLKTLLSEYPTAFGYSETGPIPSTSQAKNPFSTGDNLEKLIHNVPYVLNYAGNVSGWVDVVIERDQALRELVLREANHNTFSPDSKQHLNEYNRLLELDADSKSGEGFGTFLSADQVVKRGNVTNPPSRTPKNSAIEAIDGLVYVLDAALRQYRSEAITASKANTKTWDRYMTDQEARDAENLTRWTLPDPTNTTTLGETLFVALLGKRESRERILRNFTLQVERSFRNVYVDPKYGSWAAQTGRDEDIYGNQHARTLVTFRNAVLDRYLPGYGSRDPQGAYPYFLNAVLGNVLNGQPEGTDPASLTANQKEILTAIQTRTREAAGAEVRHLLYQINNLHQSGLPSQRSLSMPLNAPAVQSLREQYYPLVGWLQSFLITEAQGNSSAAKITYPTPGITWYQMGKTYVLDGSDPSDKTAYAIAELARSRNALASATGRVAAADDMIKRLIQVTENDLDHFFVDPAMEDLRNRITRTPGVELGVLQKESLLVTNRLVGRVDPVATGTVESEGTQDFLGAAQQLGNLISNYADEKRREQATSTLPLLGATGGVLAGADFAKTTLPLSGALALLGSIASVPKDPPGEIYSISSGNLFQVTPVFDPSGQALRFRFDFNSTINVQEPGGSTNRLLPRVERHTVNNEVQLTNLEFREISSFETNYRIGREGERTGGIPILKEFPILKEIPIVGYYARTKSVRPQRQESIIFAHSSLYPTIGDLINLLTDVPTRSDLQISIPPYLSEPITNDSNKDKK